MRPRRAPRAPGGGRAGGRRLPGAAWVGGSRPRGDAGCPRRLSGRRSRRAERVELRAPVAEDVVPLVPGLLAGAGEVAVGQQEGGLVARRPGEEPAPLVADHASAHPVDATLVTAAVADGDEDV